ncbi:MAG TPA: GNAT family N-acetyltransferase [Archangium sp.]|nr:GNAT family N-acetyltransferase [Archangium sp.]
MFTSERLLIRAWQESDAEAFYELTQDEGFNLYPINVYRQKSLDTAREWLRKVKGKFAVLEKDSSELIGMGGLTPWTWEGEELVDITYRLRESAWGKGYGWELAQALVQHGFRELGLEQITATITPDNVASKKIAEKLGMTFDRHILLLGVPTELYRLRRTSLLIRPR